MPFPIWENFSTDIVGYATSAYSSVEPYFWPLIFIGIIGYIYAGMQSVIVAVVGILITFGLFATTTSIFEAVPQITQFFYIVTVIGICMLIAAIIIHKRRS